MGRALQPDFETTWITIGCGAVDVVGGCVVVVVVDVDVVEVTGTAVVVGAVSAEAVDPRAAWLLGLVDAPKTQRAAIEEATAIPKTERVRMKALR